MTTLIINSINTRNPFLPERTSKNKTVLSERGDLILSRMQTSVFELLTCAVWGCPECYVMQERGTGIEAEYG